MEETTTVSTGVVLSIHSGYVFANMKEVYAACSFLTGWDVENGGFSCIQSAREISSRLLSAQLPWLHDLGFKLLLNTALLRIQEAYSLGKAQGDVEVIIDAHLAKIAYQFGGTQRIRKVRVAA